MEQPDFQHALHQHHAQNAAPCGRCADQKGPAADQQGTHRVEPPQGVGMYPSANLGTGHAGRTAQQQGQKKPLGGPAQLHEPLLQEHLGQIAGDRDDRIGSDEFCRQRAAAQGGGTVPHQLRELARQLSQGMGTPGGLCLGDHRFLQQEHGQCGNAAEQRTHQIKAGKPQKPPHKSGKGRAQMP